MTRLHRGDLAFGCDFRRVYGTVLQHWLKFRPNEVLGGAARPLNLIKRA
jgi:hypothetical protein